VLNDPANIPESVTPRVVLVDDHDLFRTGLRNLLEEQNVQVVGECDNGTDALRAVRELAPDVVVMDLNMPGISGVEATRQISMIAPLTRVLVLTISDQDSDVMDAILAGACGYLLKDASIAELIQSELSDREIQVLKLIANGKDNAMIAGELHISPKTVKNHISNILMKLQIDNRIQAAVYAVRSGIV
jgi:DNA-binding NarL/FixJ family response regulator